MAMTLEQRRAARDFAKTFAAGLVENAEIGAQADVQLNDEQFVEAKAEMLRIAARIEATLSQNV
ncbi:hypothetical protein BLA13014_07595 [Burkholderia aenigmatica]|uniref:Uncharacterized protein n=1 Tax=Burkholderia aenigmatica TaxID=2015348 RepID=A0A6P2T0K5_9BURK|nr:hypothetical protein [Burkholderia aenigmatica]VWC49450.1 hypothetical protein BLA13014_07595 [Burkholderia aenigmatica]